MDENKWENNEQVLHTGTNESAQSAEQEMLTLDENAFEMEHRIADGAVSIESMDTAECISDAEPDITPVAAMSTTMFAENPSFTEKTRLKDKPRGRWGFKRTAAIVAIAAILGGGTLGGGLGAGYAISNYFLPDKASTAQQGEDTLPVFSTNNEDPTIIPINVQTSNFSGIVKSVSESVVSINMTAMSNSMFGMYESEGAGSGIIYKIDDDKVYVATNNHVINGANTVSVSLDDNESVEATVLGSDDQSDLAILSISKTALDALGIPYKAAIFGDSSLMEVGDQVVAIGNSMGEGKTATSGIVSAINKQIDVENKTLNVLQTDAAINMGNSGGPLVNDKGEVIGINTAKLYASGVEGMGYSIPMNDAIKVLEGLLVGRPYLGINLPRTVNAEMMELYSLPTTGVLVTSVEETSGAGKAGMQANDIIVAFNGTTITSVEELVAALAEITIGDEVTVSVYRGNEQMEFTVEIGNINDR